MQWITFLYLLKNVKTFVLLFIYGGTSQVNQTAVYRGVTAQTINFIRVIVSVFYIHTAVT